ncbi:MAG: hypothetical protein A3J28_13700 [Acidobacteria bacterium RIFCSPLOWO2_12_FULL_60_22]|nr:MAG: hypothetical protein A3J28_13700 [Acidobacteria bacterium RIFCSPLOWO2_12_FULL_60_22]
MKPVPDRVSMGRFYAGFLERLDRPGWKKFAWAMVALAVAFLLAIFSSVFAQEGRVVATGICASLALALSGYVALTAVPYLARRTSLEWLRVSIDYEVTREGWAFIAMIFVLAIAGLNTGNNLLYLVLASLLAGILMSGILSFAVLMGVGLEVSLPDHVFARRPVPARLRLENQKRLLPSFSIVLSGSEEAEKRARQKPRGRAPGQALPVETDDRRILRQPLYFPFLPAAQSVTRSVELEFRHRGLYRENGFALSTRFPFGFLEKKLQLPVSHDLWVYPAVEPTEEFYEILPMLSGEMESFQRGRGHDLYSIRDLVPTDSARHIDWKASARTGTLKVREFTREDERRLQLILDRRIGPLLPKALEQFEAAVEFCACLAWHFSEVDAQLQFLCDEFQTPVARAGETIYDILQFLAAVEPSSEPPLHPPAVTAEENLFRIICTAAPRGSVPTAVWSRSYLIFFDELRPGRSQESEVRSQKSESGPFARPS